ncbi:unnamed protein product [Brassicogethes aeneus]|uniref:Uncharacterized protein n=1 Tax=Brassicogethes aeneus TaxID=1431903 RepID=A0A9P0BIB7_BRAAE|nr:unnamed protein product [Brassicogethes aeneus]
MVELFIKMEDKLLDDEKQTFVFGFSTTELVESVRLLMSDSHQIVLKSVQEKLKNEDRVLDDSKIQEIHDLFLRKAEEPLKKFENEVRTVMAIESKEEDTIEEYTDEDVHKLKLENEELDKEYLREKLFLLKCKQRKQEFDQHIKPVYEQTQQLINSYKNELDQNLYDAINLLKLTNEQEDCIRTELKDHEDLELFKMDYKPKNPPNLF